MQIIAVQLDIAWEDAAANCAKVAGVLRAGPIERGALVALPEMFASGFSMDVAAATKDQQATVMFLGQLAAELGIHIVAGLAMSAPGGKGKNTAIMIAPSGAIVGSYTKIHPFTLGGEREHYLAGDGVVTFGWDQFTVSPFICYDLRFPESFRDAARRGAELFVVIANWPIARAEHWLTLLQARAIENQAYVLGVNRCGRDPNTCYGGRSILVDPMGVIRADAGDGQGLMVADVSIHVVRDVRERLPFLRNA